MNNYRVKVCCLNQGKHISALLKEGVDMGGMVKEGRSLSFTVTKKQLPVVEEYFAKFGIAVEKYALGADRRARKLLIKLPLLISAFLVVAAFAVFFNFVIFVKIEGNANLDEASIKERLFTCATIPSYKKTLDLKKIKNAITEMDGVALCSVKIKGCVLEIKIDEELEAEIPDVEEFAPIVAAYDSIITSIVVERGTALVEVGRSVKKGEVLIAPYYVLNEETRLPCQALGWVEGRVFRETSTLFTERRLETEVESTEITRDIYLGDIPLGKKIEESADGLYLTETRDVRCGFLTIKEKTVKKLTVKEIFRPFDEVKEGLEQELYAKIYIDIKNNMQIVDKWCIIEENAGTYSVKCFVETIEMVSIKGG
ncbi:MAG: sporulation protein YqfD [Clostridia bacterium]|nr:sporulation protein YqfD [Clostridia bacterium]